MKPKQKTKKITKGKEKKNPSELFNFIMGNKYTHIVFLLIITTVFITNYSAIFDRKLDQGGDNIYYISLGKALAEGKGYTNTIGFTETPHTHFPPGYPVFIAGLTKLFPGNLFAFKVANGVLLFLSIVLIFFLLKRISGSTLVAFITCLLCCLHADMLRWASIIMSEMLYLFLSIVSLLLSLEIYEKGLLKKKWMSYLIAAGLILIVNYIYFVRTMGMSIILSFILWFTLISLFAFWQWNKLQKAESGSAFERLAAKRTMLYRGLILLLMLVSFAVTKFSWDARNSKIGAKGSTYIANFNKKLNGQVMSTTEDWIARIKSNSKNYMTKWVPNSIFFTAFDVKGPTSTWEWIRGSLVFLVMAFGLFRLKKFKWLLAFYMAATMLVLIFYPEQYGGSRYYLGIIPFFIFLLLNGISELIYILWKLISSKYNPVVWQAIGVITFSVIFMFPSSVKAQEAYRKQAKLNSWKSIGNIPLKEFIEAIEWCNDNLTPEARLLCRKPELYYIYSGYRHAEMFPQYGEPDSVLNIFIKKKATHVILDNMFRHSYVTVAPMIMKYPEKFKAVHQIGEFNKESKRNATLVYEFNPEWGYYGEKINGVKEGKAYEIYQDGRKYVGDFTNNLPNGFGEFYDADGKLVVKGLWKDGKMIKPE